MFNGLSNLFNTAVNTIKNALTKKSAPPKPAANNHVILLPKIKPITEFPKFTTPPPYNPYIANWGDSKATIAAGQANNDAQMAAHNSWYKAQQDEIARAAAEKAKRLAQEKFDSTKNQYASQARKTVDQVKDNEKGNFFSWLTGGFTGENNARDFAQKEADRLAKEQVPRYEKKLNTFLTEQAKRKAEIEKKKFSTQEEFDQAVGIFSKWETENIDDLEFMRAASAGMAEGYGTKAQAEGTSAIAQTGKWLKGVVDTVAANPIFKYTLGSGDENVPSLVTAPARLVNTIGNAFDQKGNKNYFDKVVKPGIGKKSPWQASYNQRNFNMSQPQEYSDKDFESWYKTRDHTSQWKDYDQKKVKEFFRGMYKSQLTNDEMANNVTEFLADPLTLVGWGAKAIKGSATASRWGAAADKAITGSSIFSKIKNSKFGTAAKWLNKEYKSTDQLFAEALKKSKSGIDDLQKTMVPRINAMNAKLKVGSKIDTSILDDLGKLSDHEIAVIQKMKNGKFSFRDNLALRDIKGLRYTGGQREKLLDLSKRWTDFTEKMKASDEVLSTRFGAGKKTYSPFIDYTGDHSADSYNFFAKKKNVNRVQSSADFSRNATDRYLRSNLGQDLRREAAATDSAWVARRESARARYASRVEDLTAPVKALDIKRGTMSRFIKQRRIGQTPTTSFGRSLFNSANNAVHLPTRLWKKSVLTYRPAWTVNNIGYNLQGSTLAGGAETLIEHGRLLRPKNWRNAMKEIPDAVRTNLTGELRTGYKGRNIFKKIDSKLNSFNTGVENWSRVSAYRTLKNKGLTDTKALNRVNKYMFDYSTKNWERPFKAVMPFWSWNKSLAKASVQMPLDRPFAAKAYNAVDRYQNNQFDAEFEKTVPELTKLGYSESEIQTIKEEQAKYYKGRLKVGNQWITTPFNAFSDHGLSGIGVNPFLSSLSESATATDSFGRKISGTDALYRNRVLSKFPQYELGKKAINSFRVATGVDKPKRGWIGEKGSEGYGLGKERQGFDPKAANYDRNMDPRAKLGQDALAFVGVPRGLEFDTKKLVETKELQKATEAYFALDTKNMDFDAAEKARQDVFKKYGITSDDFYKGILSKYDTQNTTRIKGLKESAATANKSLFNEYAAQPDGTRNVWATNKLRELNSQNYFADNPFKKSFIWVNPTTVAKADKTEIVQKAVASGDWSAYRNKYGTTQKQKDFASATTSGDWTEWESKYGRSEKALARDKAVASGDWTDYIDKYGVSKTTTAFQFDGKYFKSATSMAKYKKGKFWESYAAAGQTERRTLLKNNPQYNERADWTDQMWDDWNAKKKLALVTTARSWGDFAARQDLLIASAKPKADRFLTRPRRFTPIKLT
jgi:hypothetical protein